MSNNQVITVLDRQSIPAANTYTEAIDLGAFRRLELQCVVHAAGAANSVLDLQHSADKVNWIDDGSATLGLDVSAGSSVESSVSHFLRYVRFKTGTTAPDTAVVSLYVVAKEV